MDTYLGGRSALPLHCASVLVVLSRFFGLIYKSLSRSEGCHLLFELLVRVLFRLVDDAPLAPLPDAIVLMENEKRGVLNVVQVLFQSRLL